VGQESTWPPAEVSELDHLEPLVAAALMEVEGAELSDRCAILVRRGRGVERGVVLPHPDCPRCRGRAAGSRDIARLRDELRNEDAVPTTAERIRAIFGDSPFAPLSMTEAASSNVQFPFDAPYVFGDTRLARVRYGRLYCTSLPGGVHGSAPAAERSRLLAWSEGVERLCAQSACPDVHLAATDPEAEEARARYGRQSDGENDEYCHALDLLRDSVCLVPFRRVGVNVPGRGSVENTFTGTASHMSCLDALLHGTVEALKRDAFMIAWYRRRRLDRLAWPVRMPSEIGERLQYLTRYGLTMRLYDLRSDVPLPTLLLHLRTTRRVGNWPEGGSLLVPAGGFTPMDALRHALSLACSRFVGLALDSSPERDPLDPLAVERLGERISFWPPLARYLDPKRAPALEFLFGDGLSPLESISCPTVPETPRLRYEVLREWLDESGIGWLAVPLTDEHVRACGLRVVKAILPGAIPLTLAPESSLRDRPRFHRRWAGTSEGSWNEDPHPVY
jgi:thiazole/oxazole-forming peptide maturase SagD family component